MKNYHEILGKIYTARCIVTNKFYVGKTIKTLEERRENHLYLATKYNKYGKFYNAIRKYGVDNFEWSVIEDNIKLSKLDKLEKKYISMYDSFYAGYNSTFGGEGAAGFAHSEETRKKISDSNKGRTVSAEVRDYLSKLYTGRELSELTKRQISKNNAKFWKNKHLDLEVRKKISNSVKKFYNEQNKQKHSEIMKVAMKDEKVRKNMSKAQLGRKHTELSKKKISEKTKGIKNPMYGTLSPNSYEYIMKKFLCTLDEAVKIRKERYSK